MNILFEEDGGFKAGKVLSEAGASYQTELATGRRVKVKNTAVLLKFEQPSSSELMAAAEAQSNEMDLDFLWECAPQEEFNFQTLAADYFGRTPSAVESAALLLRLHSAPVYFHRKGKGHYRPAPPDILQAALAAVEKRKREAEQQAQWAEQLAAGQLPAEIAAAVDMLLFKPDKNSGVYKALELASQQSQQSHTRLLLKAGALRGAYDLHYRRFLHACFPRGTHFPELPAPLLPNELPLANVQAFSIDDAATTEIDDAFSVQWDAQSICIGIHIAAPGLAITRGDAVDTVARQRLSTVYMPGDKITMLPESYIQHFTLQEGKVCPALSLYVWVATDTHAVQRTETRVERVPIAANLRLNVLDEKVTEQALESAPELIDSADFPFARELQSLWQFAKVLTQQRETVRGKPEVHHRVDYNFVIGADATAVAGEQPVEIIPRRRGAPLDKIVSELMIFANSTWGALLAEHQIPGMYRVQTLSKQGFAKVLNTRMTTKPGPHMGLGVAQYAWSTSPLRRYADLVNQWQLLACVQQHTAPFQSGDADLFALVSSFDATYSSYAEFQQQMENYWCLQWLLQRQVREVHAHVVREEILRLAELPFVLRLPGLPVHPRGTEILLEIIAIDLIDLQMEVRCKAVLGLNQAIDTDADEMDDEADVEAGDTARAAKSEASVQDSTNLASSVPPSAPESA